MTDQFRTPSLDCLDDLDAILDITDIPPSQQQQQQQGGQSISTAIQTNSIPAIEPSITTVTSKSNNYEGGDDDILDTTQLDDLLIQMEGTGNKSAPDYVGELDTSQLDDLLVQMENNVPITVQNTQQPQNAADDNNLGVLDTSQLDDILSEMQQTVPQSNFSDNTANSSNNDNGKDTKAGEEEEAENEEDIEILSENENEENSNNTLKTELPHSKTLENTPKIPQPQPIITTEKASRSATPPAPPSGQSSPLINSQLSSSSSSTTSLTGSSSASVSTQAIPPVNSPFKSHFYNDDASFGNSPEILEALDYTTHSDNVQTDDSDDMYGPSSSTQQAPSHKPLPSKRFIVYSAQFRSKASATVSPSDSSSSPQQPHLHLGSSAEPSLESQTQTQLQTQAPLQTQSQTQTKTKKMELEPNTYLEERITVDIKESINPTFQESSYEKLALLNNSPDMELEQITDINMFWESVRVPLAHGIWSAMNLSNSNLRMFDDLIVSFMKKNKGVSHPEQTANVLRVLNSCDVKAEQTDKGFLFPLLEAFFGSLGFSSFQAIHGVNLAKNALNTHVLNPWLIEKFVPVLKGTCRYFLRGFNKMSAVLVCQRQWRSILFTKRLANITQWYNPRKVRSFRHLIEDERAFAEDLKVIDENFYKPLLELSGSEETEVLPQDEINALFGQFCVLRDTQTYLLAGLDEIVKTWPHLFYGPDLVVAHAFHFTAYSKTENIYVNCIIHS